MNRAYKKFFKEHGVTENFPARTAVEVAELPVPGMLLEIDVIAAV
jgi:enamine deaminase RidA (YjgF/YER057c/UK114 family)